MNTTDLLAHMQRTRKLYERCLESPREAFHLTTFEADVLCFLHHNPQMDTAGHIVEYRMLPKANVSKAVDSLVQRGYLSAVRDTEDRRRIHLKLTQEALPAAQAIHEAQENFGRTLLHGFSEEERRYYETFWLRLAQNTANALPNERNHHHE